MYVHDYLTSVTGDWPGDHGKTIWLSKCVIFWASLMWVPNAHDFMIDGAFDEVETFLTHMVESEHNHSKKCSDFEEVITNVYKLVKTYSKIKIFCIFIIYNVN